MKQIWFLVFFFFSISLYAQPYDYDAYRFPDLKVKGFQVDGNMLSSSFHYQNKNNFNLNAALGSQYFTLENTVKIQKYHQIYTIIDYSKVSDPINLFNIPKQEFNAVLSSYGETRKFFSPTDRGIQRFFEIDHVVNAEYLYQLRENGFNPNEISQFSSFLALPLKIGKGRLEPLSGIPLAEFLADDLQDSGLLNRKFTQDELFQLAQKIVAVNNTRVFDFRRANIFRLTELSNWLVSQGIPQSIETFTILNDNYRFAFSGIRNQGKKQSIGIIPIFTTSYYNPDIWNTGYGLGIQYERINQKNISKNLHKSWRFVGSFYLDQDIMDFENMVTAKISHEVTYLPNSRTIMSLGPSISTHFIDFVDWMVNLRLYGTINYFVNNRLRITSVLSTNYMATTGYQSSYLIPGVLSSDFYQPDFYRVGSIRPSTYTYFQEKLQLTGSFSFSYFLY